MIDEIIEMRTLGKGLDNDGQFWSEKNRKLLEEYFLNGIGITQIAILMKRSEPAIVQQLIRQGLFNNETKKRNRVKGCPKKCICEKCENYEVCPYSPKNRNTESGKEAVKNV